MMVIFLCYAPLSLPNRMPRGFWSEDEGSGASQVAFDSLAADKSLHSDATPSIGRKWDSAE